MISQPTLLFLGYCKLNELWPNYQKDLNQDLNHTTLQNFVLRIFVICVRILLHVNLSCESFLECETSLDDSIDSGNFSMTGYLPLIWWKGSITHMHVLAA